MYRLLIVDDEQHIVHWLYDLFSSVSDFNLEVYKAYSGREALHILHETNIDIILSDYRMPGMSGLELLNIINENWSDRRVVFLSGYNEFDYIYKVTANGAISYLLKTEDDEKILNVVLDAVRSIETERKQWKTIEEAEVKGNLLQYLELCNSIKEYIEFQENAANIFPFNPDSPILLGLGTIISFEENSGNMKWIDLQYSLFILFERYFSKYAINILIGADKKHLTMLLQGIPGNDRGLPPITFLTQRLENFQKVAFDTLNISIDIILHGETVVWKFVKSVLNSLRERTSKQQDIHKNNLSITFSPAELSEDACKEDNLSNRVYQYISNNLAGDLTLTNISRYVFYNPSYISRMFRKEMGINLTAYILRERLAKAKELLSSSRESIHSISELCGFDSPQYFATVFKKHIGSTPNEYRFKNFNHKE